MMVGYLVVDLDCLHVPLPRAADWHGWGYRGWGAPYPSCIQRRREQAATAGGSAQFDHYAWGWGGDFVWMILMVGMFWAFFGIWWR